MSWIHRYYVREYLASATWIAPLASMLLGLFAARMTWQLDVSMGWYSPLPAEAVRGTLSTLAGVVFTLIVFISSALLIALQLASAQLTPRFIALIIQDRIVQYSLSLFVFTFAFLLTVMIRIDTVVPLVTARVASYSSVVSLGVFLVMTHYVARSLRPSAALRRVALVGREVIEGVYPRPLPRAASPSAGTIAEEPLGECTQVVTSVRDGSVQAFDVGGITSLAQSAGCVLALVPQVGDFIARGDPLFRVYGNGGAAADASSLRRSVAIGQERTMTQDPTFAFRIIVDIAAKALSPAINDPTTAVLALDQIHRLLQLVGTRSLADDRVRDSAGRLRLVFRTPNWEDFVRLAATEIRHFGGESIQIVRRLRAMHEHLIHTLPEERTTQLRHELMLLDNTAVRCFADVEDQSLANVGDLQGIGGRADASDSVSVRVARSG